MLQFDAAIRKEERARAPQINGHIVLPEASEMAESMSWASGSVEPPKPMRPLRWMEI